MNQFLYAVNLFLILLITHLSWGFPVDLSSVGTGQLHSVWLASSPVFAVVFIFVMIVILFGCVCCKPGKGFKEFRNSNGALAASTEFVNPRAGSELTIFPPPGISDPETVSPSTVVRIDPPNDHKHSTLRPASFSSSERPLSSQDWFYEPHLNFPRGQLQYLQDYGRGWFGRVIAGEAINICPPEPRTKVIVKILHEDATPTDQMFFLHEVKPHRDLKHPNILRLLGRCLETEPFLLLLESCPNGDLKTFLTQNMASAHALTEQGITLRMARDVTAGLEFMHAQKYIHTDLAARNCLVSPDLTIKIGDYGNSIELFPKDYYIAGSVALPVRWCAPETLRCTDVTIETKEVTTFANVWTLAVVIWEICDFGGLPYEELTDDQVIIRVLGENNYLLRPPSKFCLYKEELYHLMKLCWRPQLQRPTVAQIKLILDNLVSSDKSTDSLHFEERWHISKPNTIPKTDNAEVLTKVVQSRSAKIADSNADAPMGAFLEDSKPLGSESPRFRLKRSDSTQNLSGSIERLNELSKQTSNVYKMAETELDSWLQGVEVKNEDDENFVRNVSEAIRDLDMALASEKTSSSEATSGKSSHQSSPGKELKIPQEDAEDVAKFVVDFKLGADTSAFMMPPKSFELSSLQNTMEPQSLTFTSLIFPEEKPDPIYIPSLSDAEEEIWKNRIERGEFSEKVKEKSKSIADLMILTHIDPSDESDEGDRERNSLAWRSHPRSSLSSTNFGSESDIRNAVLDQNFEEGLKKLSNDHKELGRFDSLNMIVPDESKRVNVMKTFESSFEPGGFLCKNASENCDNIIKSACQTSHFLEDKRSDIPVINVDEVVNEEENEEEENLVFNYPKKPLRFVLKEDEKPSVILGPFEDHTLNHYQGIRTTFGNADIIDSWNNHLNSALEEQLNRANFDNVTFQSLEHNENDNDDLDQVDAEPIINKITNLGDSGWSEEENDGKLRTPDDERSSDSGFRDKGSLSESVEDACEGKYNLEDIEAELEEAFVKGAFNNNNEANDKKNCVNFEYEESKFYGDDDKNDDISDIEGELDMWQPNDREYYPEMSESSPKSSRGWYLHPPDEKSAINDGLDDEFVKALRNELAEKLPIQSRSFEQEDEELEDIHKATINIDYSTSSSLTPIFEEGDEQILKSPSEKPKRKNVVGLMESVKNIDTETFMQYLEYMVENEGKEDDSVVEEIIEIVEDDTKENEVLDFSKASEAKELEEKNEVKDNFEDDIKTAIGFEENLDVEEPKSLVFFEDLEVGDGTCEIVDETKAPLDDLILVDTSTNEAVLLESPKPKSHIAFVSRSDGDYTPDSISPNHNFSISEDSSSRGEASTDITSSPDLLSDFFITPDKTPFQSPRTIPKITTVEELHENDEAKEIVGALLELKTPAQESNVLQYVENSTLPKIKSATEQFLYQERLHTTDLLNESSKKLEQFEMSTSFMGNDEDDDVSEAGKEATEESGVPSDKIEGSYTPDWETCSSDEDGSSSSGEFIWKDGGKEAQLKAKQASFDLEPSLNEDEEGENSEGDDSSSSSDSASITGFVPSAWDSQAIPKKPAIRSASENVQLVAKDPEKKRRVWFKKEKYHCIYEYPREPSDTEDLEVDGPSSRTIDYTEYANWDLNDADADYGVVEDEAGDGDECRGVRAKRTVDASNFYTLGVDSEAAGPIREDGEFYVSSSTRPFQSKAMGMYFTGSQFSAFGAAPLWADSPTTDNLLDERDFTTPDSGVEDMNAATPGEAASQNKINSLTITHKDAELGPRTNEVPSLPYNNVAAEKCVTPGLRRPARESLTLDLPKNHNSELGLIINGNKKNSASLDE